jgi:hypothetical protein
MIFYALAMFASLLFGIVVTLVICLFIETVKTIWELLK